MGILSRFKDIMSANINALLDKVEDPEKMIDQCLRNMNDDLVKVKQETASVMAQEKACKRQVDECQAGIDKMQSYAVKALTAGNEDDARRFLAEKNRLTTKLTDLQANYAIAHDNSQKMRDMHDKLTSDIKELEFRKETIKGKIAVAKAQERINEMTSSVTSANNSIASFERYEQLANKRLDKAQAVAELNASNPTNSIKDLTAKYVNDPNVDAELEALKASLGMSTPSGLPQ
ncbi:MAG: PspA/IM30 family protein [Lachnospiraceae bacterium]|nr:PspA/IM30 family protein [Lachnospiraceae bacterium]